MSAANDLRVRPEETGLLIVDWQERLAAAMPDAVHARNLKNACNLIRGARLFGVPMVMTLQYPRGLGPAVADVHAAFQEALPGVEGSAADSVATIEKRIFSVMGVDEARAAMEATGRKRWVVVGMETHVCIYQSVRDMSAAGHHVYVPRDAVVSRLLHNYETGLELCRAAGATVTSAEAVLFDWCEAGEGERFKAVSRMVR